MTDFRAAGLSAEVLRVSTAPPVTVSGLAVEVLLARLAATPSAVPLSRHLLRRHAGYHAVEHQAVRRQRRFAVAPGGSPPPVTDDYVPVVVVS